MTDTITFKCPFACCSEMECAHVTVERGKAEQLRANLDAALAAKTKREREDWDIVWDPGAKRHVVYIAGSMYWLMRFPAGTLEASSLVPAHFANMPCCGNLRTLLEQGQLLALNKAELKRIKSLIGTGCDNGRLYNKIDVALAACTERGE